MPSKEERPDGLLGVPYLTVAPPEPEKGTSLKAALSMFFSGAIALISGWALTGAIIAGVGILPDVVVFVATFSAVLWAAVIGTVVYFAGKATRSTGKWFPVIASGIIAFPLAISDPWVIVALGMRSHASLALRALLLALPVAVGALFAHPAVAERKFSTKLIALAALLLAIYIVIYWFVLPGENLIAIQRPLR